MRAAAFAALALLCASPAGAQAPRVGDTIWVARAALVPPRFVARIPEWQPEGDVELLGPARLISRGDSAVVEFPIVVWLTGTRTVEVPGPVLVGPDGAADSVPPAPISVAVASVLPDQPLSTLRPQPPSGIVPRTESTPIPLLALAALAAAVLIPLHLLWRRRGQPIATSSTTTAATPPLDRWAAAGEARAVAASAALSLRAAIAARVADAHTGLETAACIAVLAAASSRPGELPADAPADEIATLLRDLDDARFRPEPRDDALALAQRAAALAERLRAAPPPAAPSVGAAA
jgi:hypothetical protein